VTWLGVFMSFSPILSSNLMHFKFQQNIPQKKCVRYKTLKVGTELAGSTQNSKKNYPNINSTDQNEIFRKKKYV
jgi:hypothetical protein